MKPSKLTALSLATVACAFVAYKTKDESKPTKEQLINGETTTVKGIFQLATIVFGTLMVVELMRKK